MAMTIMAAEAIFNDVKDRFAIEASDVKLVFGWREPGKQVNQGGGRANRIAFVPGDDDKAGDYLGARYPGKLSRALRTMLEPITIYCWAYDSSAPNDELAQWRACRFLLDATIRAVDLALRKFAGLHDQHPLSAAKWVNPNIERPLGAEVKFVLTLMSTVPDELPDLSGPTKEETLLAAPEVTVEIADSEDFAVPGEEDPPPLTPADDE